MFCSNSQSAKTRTVLLTLDLVTLYDQGSLAYIKPGYRIQRKEDFNLPCSKSNIPLPTAHVYLHYKKGKEGKKKHRLGGVTL